MKLRVTVEDRYANDVAEMLRPDDAGGDSTVYIKGYDSDPVPVESVKPVESRKHQRHDGTRDYTVRYRTPDGTFTAQSLERAVEDHRKLGLLRSWKRNHDGLDKPQQKNPQYTVVTADRRKYDLAGIWDLRAFVLGLASARAAFLSKGYDGG